MSKYSMLKQFSDERAQLVNEAAAAACAVVLRRRRVLSGIRWREDLVVTAAEAIGGAEQVGVRFGGDEVDAEVVATDLGTDVAVLRVGARPDAAATAAGALADTGAPAVGAQPDTGRPAAGALATTAPPGGLPRATSPRIGETIALIGRSLYGPAAVWGSVQLAGPAWLSRRGGKIDQRLEFDVGFEPSFEGAAIIDMSGAIVGMSVPGPYRTVLGIPAQTIETVVAKIEQFGHLPRPYIGIRLQPLWLDDDTRTKLGRKSRGIAAVGGVDAGSPAANAHIELGDLLLTLDGEPADSVNGLARRIAGIDPGRTVAFEVLRGGKPITINVQVGERPRH